MQRHLTVLQLSRYVGIDHEMLASQRLEFVAELGRHYDAGLQLGELWLLLTTVVVHVKVKVKEALFV